MADSILRVIPRKENSSRGHLWWRGRPYPCALGKGGVLPASRKREGDNASPAGVFPLPGLYYRADRFEKPETGLPTLIISPELGWCDDAECVSYNSAVNFPHAGSAEALWRADGVYDLLVVIGHNQGPAVSGLGSAIFLHVARGDFLPTRGCIAIAREAFFEILPDLNAQAMIRIQMP